MAKPPKTPIDRRERIVQAALELFAEKGVPDTRLSEVARKAGLDQPLINYHFPTLESLYAEVIARVLMDLKAWVLKLGVPPEGQKGALEFLLRYSRATLEYASRKPGYFSIWMYFYYLASYAPLFEKLNHEIRVAGRERISGMIYRAIEQGSVPRAREASVSDLAAAIQSLITGSSIIAFTEGRPKAWVTHARALETAILLLLGAKKN